MRLCGGKVLDAVGDATPVSWVSGTMDAGSCPHVHGCCCPWLMGDVPDFQSTGLAPAPGGTGGRGVKREQAPGSGS